MKTLGLVALLAGLAGCMPGPGTNQAAQDFSCGVLTQAVCHNGVPIYPTAPVTPPPTQAASPNCTVWCTEVAPGQVVCNQSCPPY